MAIRMLVVDVDGTLIGRSQHVTPRVRAAVRAALDAGALVTLATGRWFRSAQPVAAELGIELPIILHNGALVRDSVTGEVLHECHLPRDLALEAVGIVRRHGLQPIVYENDQLITAGPVELDSSGSSRYLGPKMDVRRVPLEQLTFREDPIEVLVVDTAERVEPLVRALATDRWNTLTSMSTAVPDDRLVEVVSRDCSKTNAIRRLAERYGVSLHEIMAVGDNFNDLDMIEGVGFGVAMGNAPDGVKARADWVAPSVEEDGLALAIERYMLSGPGARAAAASS